MYDSRTKDKNAKPWNVTFFDYSSHSMAPEVSNEYGKHVYSNGFSHILFLLTYLTCVVLLSAEFLHFSESSSGSTVTLHRESGTFLWQKDFSSPVVAVFLLRSDGLLSVPFQTVSDGALKTIIEYARDGQKNSIKLL